MENNLTVFTNEQFGEIRTLTRDGEPWFVAADVCNALEHSNVAMALKALDDDEKGVSNVYTLGGPQQMAIISEAGLYRLILVSRKPAAKAFKRWIVHEVLPAIRKTGVYMTPAAAQNFVVTPAFLRQVADALEKVDSLERQVAALTAKGEYVDNVIKCPNTVTVTTIAKDYGMGAAEFNKLLRKLGVQFKQGGIWHLHQPYASLGWATTTTHYYEHGDDVYGAKVLTKWTQRGREGLYELLKSHGILPTTERILQELGYDPDDED